MFLGAGVSGVGLGDMTTMMMTMKMKAKVMIPEDNDGDGSVGDRLGTAALYPAKQHCQAGVA